jgi:hypothetical protein
MLKTIGNLLRGDIAGILTKWAGNIHQVLIGREGQGDNRKESISRRFGRRPWKKGLRGVVGAAGSGF